MTPSIIVSHDKWRDGVKYLMGYGTNHTLTAADQKLLLRCARKHGVTFAKGLSQEQAVAVLTNEIGWVNPNR